MLVFYKERLVFLSVPKTGTTAFERALAPRADMVISDPPMLKHAPVYRYNRFLRPMFERVCNAEMELMAVIREPISWIGSWYRYRRRPYMKGRPNSTHDVSFDEFVHAYMKGDKPGFADIGSQASFVKSQPNGTGVTHFFKYDDQARIRGFLEERLDVKLDLTRQNVSPQMDLHLPSETEAKLRRKCAAEFALYDGIA